MDKLFARKCRRVGKLLALKCVTDWRWTIDCYQRGSRGDQISCGKTFWDKISSLAILHSGVVLQTSCIDVSAFSGISRGRRCSIASALAGIASPTDMSFMATTRGCGVDVSLRNTMSPGEGVY